MSTGLLDYIKNLVNSVKKTSQTTDTDYDTKKKELEDYINSTNGGVLPEKQILEDNPSYDRIEYTGETDEEIAKRAESELADFKNQSINAIESEIDGLNKKYEKDKLTAAAAAENAKAETDSAYSSAKESAANDSLKRGLARSSIALNKQAGLNERQAEQQTKIAAALNESIAALDAEISSLSVKREKALNDFNIAYASKLTTAINGLKDEREAKKTEALKYNNTLTEKEYQAGVDKVMKESDLYSESLSQKEKENSLNNSSAVDYSGIYDKMRDILSSMDKSEAREKLLNDDFFKNNLNDSYYYKLYNEFAR